MYTWHEHSVYAYSQTHKPKYTSVLMQTFSVSYRQTLKGIVHPKEILKHNKVHQSIIKVLHTAPGWIKALWSEVIHLCKNNIIFNTF